MNNNIVNTTPHNVNLHVQICTCGVCLNCQYSDMPAGDHVVITLPKAETPLRLETTREIVGWVDLSNEVHIPVYKTVYTAPNLPPRKDGTVYFVSGLVQSAFPDREDFLSPADLIRDADGRVIGARGLSRT